MQDYGLSIRLLEFGAEITHMYATILVFKRYGVITFGVVLWIHIIQDNI